MDYETKILLNRLIEAVEKLDSPDWWTIALAIINTIAVIGIAYMQIRIQRQQTKLQKRQTEAQEYELYRNLAYIVKEIHFESKFVVFDVNRYMMNQIPIIPDNNHWREKIKKYVDLNEKLENCEIDLELKFSKSFIDIDAYKRVLMAMSYFSSFFEKLLLENKVKKRNWGMMTIEKPYIESAKKIATQISEEYQYQFVCYLTDFLDANDGINEEETMQKIKQRCKID